MSSENRALNKIMGSRPLPQSQQSLQAGEISGILSFQNAPRGLGKPEDPQLRSPAGVAQTPMLDPKAPGR